MKPTMFFLINSIDVERGGLTRASLKQASFFANLGYDTHMLTFNFNPKYPYIHQKLLDLNRSNKNVKIHNMYEDLEGVNEPRESNSPFKKASLTELTEGLPHAKRKGHCAYRVYKNGMYLKYIALHDDTETLSFIDYFNENRHRIKRKTFDLWGNLKRITFMDLKLNKPRQMIYYNNEGKAFLAQWINPKDNTMQRIILFNEDGSINREFVNDNLSHKVHWLARVINRINAKKYVVISDTRSTDEVLLNLNHQKVAKIWRLHSGHLDNPYTLDANIAPHVSIGMKNIDNFDAAVVLTEEQKRDINTRFGNKPNIKVIPHFHEVQESISLNSITKDRNLAVVVSRLSTLKRINHIIKGFKIVTQKLPYVRLEITGIGDQKASLEALIKKLNLEKNVSLKGYNYNPDEVYREGLFSILTSKQEGFALSVLESMVNQTPVISYDIRYGPNDMIVNNENGFIVENENIEALASKMIYLFENPDIAIEMGKKAHNYVQNHFSIKTYQKKWLNVIDFAITNKFTSVE